MAMRRGWMMMCGALIALAGCGDDGPRGIGGNDAATTATDTAGGTDANDATTGGDADATTNDDATIGIADLPNACAETADCNGGRVCRSEVCVADPPTGVESFITDPADDMPTTTAPELGCVRDATMPLPAGDGSQTATLYGAVTRFGGGRKTTDIQVDVLLEDSFDPTACEAMTGTAQRDCYRQTGTLVGTFLSVAPPVPDALPSECTEHEECPLGYQCNDPSDLGGSCEEQFGLYEVDNVPLGVPLIIRSYATKNESNWHDVYVFGVVLSEDRVADGRVQYDATMVSHSQWLLTPNTVLLPEIPETHGVVGGRVRDCETSERVSWPIADVSIDLARRAEKVVFFNNLEDDTVPLIDRRTTNILGRFAALDIEPGWNAIAGSVRVGGEVMSAGAVPVYVVPNALSIVSWPGSQPFWSQQ